MTEHRGLYDILGADPDATTEELRTAYRKKAKEVHSDTGGEHEMFIEVAKAWETLSDPARRERYDKTGDEDPRHTNIPQDIATCLFFDAVTKSPADIATAVRQIGRAKIAEIQGSMAKLESELEHLAKAQKRIQSAPINDFLGMALNVEINRVTATIDVCQVGLDDHREALEMLTLYIFKIEQAAYTGIGATIDASMFKFGSGTTSTAGGGS